jgi:hypothetical protein
MVVGATGAIGSACARLLVRAAEEVTLVSPETAKLLALKESILQQTPDAKLVLSARADTHIGEMDMVVTATSGAGKKVLDIMKVKPGCVITDVARPLDLPPEEVAKRPDVLVIESGEILLPGDVSMKNIGLPKNVAYACLAETIVLALEGRFENFTVGRAIEWEKVRDIYKMGLKHGMRLAAISGVNGVYSDDDIEQVRQRALAARAALAQVDRGAQQADLQACVQGQPCAVAKTQHDHPARPRQGQHAAVQRRFVQPAQRVGQRLLVGSDMLCIGRTPAFAQRCFGLQVQRGAPLPGLPCLAACRRVAVVSQALDQPRDSGLGHAGVGPPVQWPSAWPAGRGG